MKQPKTSKKQMAAATITAAEIMNVCMIWLIAPSEICAG
jgi:hypothetical protein